MNTSYFSFKSLYGAKYIVTVGIIAAMFVASVALVPMRAHAATNIPLCEITRGLTVGSSGQDVQCLQRYLNWAGFTVAASGAGSAGNESQYFGSLTANAVARWQSANMAQVLSPAGLTVGTGYFGPLSFNWYVEVVKSNLGLQS